MPYRTLGRTGERISAIGLGGYHIGKQADEQESIALIRRAIDGGITFMDNCWDYNRGASEIRMGKAMRDGYREKVFLMSKIDGRTKDLAASQIDESLQRLQTDRIDLMRNSMRSFEWRIPIEFSPKAARLKVCRRLSRPAKFATSGLPDTRIPWCICWKSRPVTSFASMPCRCP
jgi:hypothetical protein